MAEKPVGLHPDLYRVVARLHQEEAFRQAVQADPDVALSDYSLDDTERQALMSLVRNWERLPAAIAEQGSGFPGLRSRTLRRILASE